METEKEKTIEIIWEDEYGMVIMKPWGMVVNRAESVSGLTVQDWAEKYLLNHGIISRNELDGNGDLFIKRSGIAHRLDKETSGCLLVAKNREYLPELLKQFKTRTIKKEYLALVHGRLEPKEGTIKLPIQRSRYDKERFQVHFAGKSAETGWKVEKYGEIEGEIVTLVRLFPVTGRTHQIRVHLSHLGFPLYADERYLGKDRRNRDRLKLPHHFLHAAVISFSDHDGKRIKVETPLPSDLVELLSWIK